MKHGSFYILFIALTAACGGFLFGFDTAVISGALSPLVRYFALEENPVLQGWIVSSVVLGSVIGAIVSGYLADHFGRKKTLVLTGILFLVSSAGAALSSSFSFFILFRLMCGVAVGVAAMASPLYLAEVSPARIRGRVVALNQLTLTVGVLLAYISNICIQKAMEADSVILGMNFSGIEEWRLMLGIAVLPSLAFLLLLAGVPESPRFLAIHAHKTDVALKLLTRVVGKQEAEREIEQIRAMSAEKILPMSRLISHPFRTTTFIALFLAIVSQLSGIDIVLHYGPIILERSGMSFGDALASQLVFGVVLVIFTSVAMWKIDAWGRRPLLLIGNAGVFVALLFIGYFLVGENFSENGLLIAISCFVASFAVSLGPVPWIIMSEIFPSSIRGQAMALATFMLFGANWLVAQLFPVSVFHLGEKVTFWVLAVCAVPTFFFIWKVLPETKGKLLEDSMV